MAKDEDYILTKEEKDSVALFKGYEERDNVVKNILSAINNWKNMSREERIVFIEVTPNNITTLEKNMQNRIIQELAESLIFKKVDLTRRVNVLNKLYKPEPEKEKKKIVKTKGWLENLINLIKIEDKVHYLLDKNGELYSAETIDINGNTFKPKQDLQIHYITESIFDIDRKKVSFAELLKEVERFIRRHLELPNEHDYFLLALWVFHTYLIDREFLTPFLYFYGVWGTGKSQAGHVLKHLAYKAESLTSVTSATMFRGAQYYRNTLIIDEISLWGRNANPDISSLILSRYQRKDAVPRIDLNDKDEENQIKYYDVFGALVICSTEAVSPIIKSRCLHFTMKQNIREAVEDLIDQNEKSLKTAEDLRNKLTIFRATFLNKELKELKHIARRRLGQIITPLYRIVIEIAPDREDEFIRIVKFLERKTGEMKKSSLEADVMRVLVNYADDGRDFIGSISLCGILNEDRSKTVEISTTKLGFIMLSLGFEKARYSGRQGYFVDKNLVEEIKEQYL